MLILAPTHFMVLSTILTNRVNKTLTPGRSAMRNAGDGLIAGFVGWISHPGSFRRDVAAGFFSPPGRRWPEGSDEGA